MATKRLLFGAGFLLCTLITGTATALTPNKASALIAQINHISELITVAENSAKEDAHKNQICEEYTWEGSKFPGFFFDSIKLYDSCHIAIRMKNAARYSSLSNLQLILQPKDDAGNAWEGHSRYIPQNSTTDLIENSTNGENDIMLFTCTIIPSKKTLPKMKPAIENYFALSASVLNKCRFTEDTLTDG